MSLIFQQTSPIRFSVERPITKSYCIVVGHLCRHQKWIFITEECDTFLNSDELREIVAKLDELNETTN